MGLALVILEHLELGGLDPVLAAAGVVEADDADQRRAQRQPEEEVGRLGPG
jgi:hypothetical protein